MFILAVVALALGARSLRPAVDGAQWRRPDLVVLVGLVGLAAALMLAAQAARAFVVKPLLEFDGWAIWATKARALYEFGGVDGLVFTGSAYASTHQEYPLLIPALEAVDFRVMGAFDGTTVHVQLALLAAGFVTALWALLRPVAWAPLAGAAAVAILAAPEITYQLATNYADVPLALFVALGVVSLGCWVAVGDPRSLVPAAIFLGAASLTKSEGLLFTAAAFAAAAIARRTRLRPLGLTMLGAVALYAPWRMWLIVHGVTDRDYSLGHLVSIGYLADHVDRVGPSARELWVQIADTGKWGYLLPLTLAGVGAALLARRFKLAAFAGSWLLLSFGGLLVVYWISTNPLEEHLFNSSYRTVVSLLVTGAALAPLLTGPVEPQAKSVPAPRRSNHESGPHSEE